MTATSLDLSQIKTDALSSAATFRTLIGLGSSDAVTFNSVSVPADSFFGTSATGSRFFPRSSSFRLYAANTLLVEGKTDSFDVHRFVKLLGGAGSVNLISDAADTLALYRSTYGQAFRLYNTYTSSTSFENLQLQWNTNEARIGTSVGSAGGTQRDIVFGSWDSAGTWNPALTITPQGVPTFSMGTVTSSQPFTVTQTWNDGATTFTGILANITDTASATTSLLMDLQVGGSSKFKVDRRGEGVFVLGVVAEGWVRCRSNTAGVSFGTNSDVQLYRDAANVLALRRDTNAQTFRLYNTYTSSTSYERLNVRWATNELIIDAEAGSGGGTLRGIKLGSAATSLLGFYGVTPVDQPLTVSDPTGGAIVDTEARTAIGEIIDRLQELGLIA